MFRFRPFRTVATVLACGASLCGPVHAQLERRITTQLMLSADDAGLAVADFNHDGKLDVVAVEKEVQIFLGNGDGTFRAPINYAVGENPNSVAVADFNGDGKLDLAVTNYLSGTVSVLLGNGDGTFQPPTTLNVLDSPSSIQAADLNGDGKPDIALINDDLRTNKVVISVFLNHGDGTFSGPVNTVPENPIGNISVGDFNRDGTLDLVAPEVISDSQYVGVFLGNGDGTFRLETSFPAPPECLFIAVGDLRGNGLLDLVATASFGLNVEVFLGNGDGTFQPPSSYTSYYSNWAAVADFNGDGKPDLIVSNFSLDGYPSGTVSILLGNGDGTFQPQMVFPDNNITEEVEVGDFNGDGQLDVITLSGRDSLTTLLNTGVVVFSPTYPLQFPTQVIGGTSPPLTVTLSNSGKAALKIDSVTCSGAPFQMTQNTCQVSLAPGALCEISATFTARAKGLVAGTFVIRDSASSRPQVVELIGTGTVVDLSPPHVKFPPQKAGTKSAPQTIRLTNIGSTALNFSWPIFVNGTNYTDFSESDDCGTQVPAGASCNIAVTFAPRRRGAKTAFVEIQDDGGGSPQRAKLIGRGD